MPSNKKHGADLITHNEQEIENNDEDRTPSDKKEDKNRTEPNNNKRTNKRRKPKEPYVEVCIFDDTHYIALFNKGN